MKKLLSILLVLATVLSLATMVFASEEAVVAEEPDGEVTEEPVGESAEEPKINEEDSKPEEPAVVGEPSAEEPPEVERLEEPLEEEASEAPPLDGAGGVAIDAAHFPDENFRAYVSGSYDSDGDGSLNEAEIAGATYLNVGNKDISSLRGIEYLSALESLLCYSSGLSALDLTKNTALKTLRCSDNQLTELDLTNNTLLGELSCGDNMLGSLDLSRCPALTSVSCENNQLTSLDVSRNTALTSLDCSGNRIAALNVSWNTALRALYCHGNRLTRLDVSGCPLLVRATEVFHSQSESGLRWYYGFSGGDYLAVVTDEAVRITPTPAEPPVSVGDVIQFGSYEQDGDTSNGSEPIDWIVLDRDGDRILVISKFILDKRQKHDERVYVFWRDCTLRSWLNEDFLSGAFTADEQSHIVLSQISTAGQYSGDPDILTEDRVFLLSDPEARMYFPNRYYRVGRLTPYAKAQTGLTFNYNVMLIEYGDPEYNAREEYPDMPWFQMKMILQRRDCLDWTLRDGDARGAYSRWVSADGDVTPDCGYYVTFAGGIRPAMWITYDDIVPPEPPEVTISADGAAAQVSGDYAGLYARVALILDNGGVSGLYVTQAMINADGAIDVPAFMVPGLTVQGVNIALVPTLADIQSSTPTVVTSASRRK